MLQFDDSCYVDAKQHHLASFSTRNSTLNTSLRKPIRMQDFIQLCDSTRKTFRLLLFNQKKKTSIRMHSKHFPVRYRALEIRHCFLQQCATAVSPVSQTHSNDKIKPERSVMTGRVACAGCRLNRPFPSYLKPLYQSEAWCTTIHMKMSLICM